MILEIRKRSTATDCESTDEDLEVFDFTMPLALRVAYHESGHAVADFALLGVLSTVIVGTEAVSAAGFAPSAGVSVPDVPANCFGDKAIEDRIRLAEAHAEFAPATADHLEKLMQVLMAGPIAEAQASNLPLSWIWRTHGTSDRKQWDKLHRALYRLRTADRASNWRRLEAQTKSLLARDWCRVERLTARLMETRSLTPSQVREALT